MSTTPNPTTDIAVVVLRSGDAAGHWALDTAPDDQQWLHRSFVVSAGEGRSPLRTANGWRIGHVAGTPWARRDHVAELATVDS